MKEILGEEKTLKTPADIWAQFIKKGNIQVGYDEELITSLKHRFGIKASEDFMVFLKQSSITNEEFLAAFFREVSPYAAMYRDLLLMFEKANAGCTDKNLKIDFDFGSGQTFDFSIEAFRQYTEQVQKAIKMTEPEQMTFLWNILPETIQGSLDRYDKCGGNEFINPSAKKWLEEYDSDEWMKTGLTCPVLEDESATGKLKIIWTCWSEYAHQCKKRYCTYTKLVDDRENRERFGGEIDRLSFSFVNKVFLLEHFLKTLSQEERKYTLGRLDAHWKELIRCSGINFYDGYEKVLEEILELPFWKKRYELYSAWVSTRILGAFPDSMVEYHVVDGKLSYSFGGSLIAGVTIAGHVVYLWAELRTRFDLSGLNRASRKGHIQPDYRMITSKENPEQSTVVVIECKQYKKANKKNFLEALMDYANACPDAAVILADYGPLPDNLTDDLDKNIRERCAAYGELIPESKKGNVFEQKLFQKVLNVFGIEFVQAPLSIELTWEEYPKDLDLWLDIESKERKVEISYQNDHDDDLCVYYGDDIKSGFGPETIEIDTLCPATYMVRVHNYSQEIYESGAEVVIIDSTGKELRKVLTSENCKNFWWDILKIDGELGVLWWLGDLAE